MCIRKNNEGMTLIELIISMAITAIVLSMIVMMISVASRSFTRTNENVNLQMEAQVAVNQISKLVMETYRIDDTSTTNITPPLDVKYRLFNSADLAVIPKYAIVFIHDKKRLYLIESTLTSPVVNADDINPIATVEAEYTYLMAEYVESLAITISTNSKTATIELKLALGDTEYSVSKRVKLRNVK
ncbi:MAG: prepilin-type N-terminal cleavage/methylation domain-containing protein [Mobilitalea sp.]